MGKLQQCRSGRSRQTSVVRRCASAVTTSIIVNLIIAAPASACGSCPTVRGGLGSVHPESLRLAIAIRRELDSGFLQTNVAPAEDTDQRRADDLQVARKLVEQLGLREGLELLLIEDGAHYHLQGVASRAGDKPTTRPSVRWVTGRAVLVALLDDGLKIEEAVKRGLVVVEKAGACGNKQHRRAERSKAPTGLEKGRHVIRAGRSGQP